MKGKKTMAKQRHKKKRKNPDAGTIAAIVIGGVIVVGGAAYYLRRRNVDKRTLTPTEPQQPQQPKGDEDAWMNGVDIEAAMPKVSDFPMGWKENTSPGYNALLSTEDPNEPLYMFEHRILELNSPSDKCSPTPCNFVAVFSGANNQNGITFGWVPTRTRQGADDELNRRERELAS